MLKQQEKEYHQSRLKSSEKYDSFIVTILLVLAFESIAWFWIPLSHLGCAQHLKPELQIITQCIPVVLCLRILRFTTFGRKGKRIPKQQQRKPFFTCVAFLTSHPRSLIDGRQDWLPAVHLPP